MSSRVVTVSHGQKQCRILSQLVILVPYQSHHVPKYNGWMQDQQLQYLTGSEPLTLAEEYQMLESWISDPKKCTFIILDRQRFDTSPDHSNEIASMIGDVNLYIFDDDNGSIGEIEIMIAEPSARRRGFGREACLLMLKFAHEHLGLDRFQAKIKSDNFGSQKLFTDHFGFVELNRSEIFNEITFNCHLIDDNDKLKKLFKEVTWKIKY